MRNMKRIVVIGMLIMVVLAWTKLANAQPDFSKPVRSHGIVMYQDADRPEIHYYLPGDLDIGRTSEGKPEFQLVMMRYTGSAVYGEGEEMRFRNILSMRMVMKNVNADSLRAAKSSLRSRYRSVSVRPLPVNRIEAVLIFTPVGGSDTSTVVARGHLSAEDESGYSSTSSYWNERHFTVHLDNHSASLLSRVLEEEYTAISFAYAFLSKGKSDNAVIDVTGTSRFREAVRDMRNVIARDSTDTLMECVVKSDAFSLDIDLSKYPDVIRKIDINDGVPPGYAVLNVRNYDFANRLRDDLYEKLVEVEATGAGGNTVNASVTFRMSDPDITSVNFRFKYAVRPDKPYRYRVIELMKDGREIISEWKEIAMWSALLDVTTRRN